jgi:hypothetical protein
VKSLILGPQRAGKNSPHWERSLTYHSESCFLHSFYWKLQPCRNTTQCQAYSCNRSDGWTDRCSLLLLPVTVMRARRFV